MVAFDLSQQRLAALKDEIGDNVAVVSGDVRSLEDNRRGGGRGAVSEFGRLTVFVGQRRHPRRQTAAGRTFRRRAAAGLRRGPRGQREGLLPGGQGGHSRVDEDPGGTWCSHFPRRPTMSAAGPCTSPPSTPPWAWCASWPMSLAPTRPGQRRGSLGHGHGASGRRRRWRRGAGGGRRLSARPGRRRGLGNNLLEVAVVPRRPRRRAYVLLASSQSRIMTGEVIHTDAGRGVSSVITFRQG